MTKKSKQEIENTTENDVNIEVSLPARLEPFVGKYTREELTTMLGEQVALLENKVVASELEDFSVTAVINEIRKAKKKEEFQANKPKSEVIRVVGFIIGDSGHWDKIGSMIGQAKSYIKKHNIPEAINAGYINGDGAFLDTRQKLFGKPNPNFGNVLTGKEVDSTRTLYLCARLGDDTTYKIGSIQTNDAAMCRGWGKASQHQFTACATWGIVKEVTETSFKLNASGAEETTSVFTAITEEINVGEVFYQCVADKLTEITKVETMYELIKEAWDRFLYVKGKVTWIGRDRPTPFGSIKMGIMDDEGNELVISLPEQVSKDFGELSEVIVYGKPDRSDLKVVGEDGKATYSKGQGAVYINAVGVYVVKATPSDVFSTDASGNEKDIEGWVS
jgi:hypothetical protein